MLECILPLCFRTLIPDYTDMLNVYTYEYFPLRIYVAVAFSYLAGQGITGWYQSLDWALSPSVQPIRRLIWYSFASRVRIRVVNSNSKYKNICHLDNFPLTFEIFSIFSPLSFHCFDFSNLSKSFWLSVLYLAISVTISDQLPLYLTVVITLIIFVYMSLLNEIVRTQFLWGGKNVIP